MRLFYKDEIIVTFVFVFFLYTCIKKKKGTHTNKKVK